MNTKEKNDFWNSLSEITREEYRDKYKKNLEIVKKSQTNDKPDMTIVKSQFIVEELENLFGKFNLSPKPLTYKDVCNELFRNESDIYETGLACTSYMQAGQLSAINDLLNVAKYLNGDWKPVWDGFCKNPVKFWAFSIDPDDNNVVIYYVENDMHHNDIVYFREKELAEQALEILGEDKILCALSADY